MQVVWRNMKIVLARLASRRLAGAGVEQAFIGGTSPAPIPTPLPPPHGGHSCDQPVVTAREGGPHVPVSLHRASSTVIINGTNSSNGLAGCPRRSSSAAPPSVSLHEPRGSCFAHFATLALSFAQQRMPGWSRHSGSDMEAVALMLNWSNGLYLILLNEATLLGNEL